MYAMIWPLCFASMNFLPLWISVLVVLYLLCSFRTFGLLSPRCHLQHLVLFCDPLQILPWYPSTSWQRPVKCVWPIFWPAFQGWTFSDRRYDDLRKAAEKNWFYLWNIFEGAVFTFGEELRLSRWDLFARLFCVVLLEGGERSKFGRQLWKNKKAEDCEEGAKGDELTGGHSQYSDFQALL